MSTYRLRFGPRVQLSKRTPSHAPDASNHKPLTKALYDGYLENFLSNHNVRLDTLVESGHCFDMSSMAIVAALFLMCRKFSCPGTTIKVLWVNGSGGNGWHLLNHLAFYLEGISNMYASKGRLTSPVSLWFQRNYLEKPHQEAHEVQRFVVKEVPISYLQARKTIKFDPLSTIVLLDPYRNKYTLTEEIMPGLKYLLDKAVYIYRVTNRFSIQHVTTTSLSLKHENDEGTSLTDNALFDFKANSTSTYVINDHDEEILDDSSSSSSSSFSE